MNDDAPTIDPQDPLERRLASLAPVAPRVDLALLRYEQGFAAGRAAAQAERVRTSVSSDERGSSRIEASLETDDRTRLSHRERVDRPGRRWYESPVWPSVSALLLASLIGSLALPRHAAVDVGDRSLPAPAGFAGAVETPTDERPLDRTPEREALPRVRSVFRSIAWRFLIAWRCPIDRANRRRRSNSRG